MKTDIVREILELVIAMAARQEGCFTEHMAREVETQVRQKYGGDRPYVAKDVERDERREKAKADLDRGVPVRVVSSRHGISRSSLYELLTPKK